MGYSIIFQKEFRLVQAIEQTAGGYGSSLYGS
jgi:hypothetical protein